MRSRRHPNSGVEVVECRREARYFGVCIDAMMVVCLFEFRRVDGWMLNPARSKIDANTKMDWSLGVGLAGSKTQKLRQMPKPGFQLALQ